MSRRNAGRFCRSVTVDALSLSLSVSACSGQAAAHKGRCLPVIMMAVTARHWRPRRRPTEALVRVQRAVLPERVHTMRRCWYDRIPLSTPLPPRASPSLPRLLPSSLVRFLPPPQRQSLLWTVFAAELLHINRFTRFEFGPRSLWRRRAECAAVMAGRHDSGLTGRQSLRCSVWQKF